MTGIFFVVQVQGLGFRPFRVQGLGLSIELYYYKLLVICVDQERDN